MTGARKSTWTGEFFPLYWSSPTQAMYGPRDLLRCQRFRWQQQAEEGIIQPLLVTLH
jgi:hypothetical protein